MKKCVLHSLGCGGVSVIEVEGANTSTLWQGADQHCFEMLWNAGPLFLHLSLPFSPPGSDNLPLLQAKIRFMAEANAVLETAARFAFSILNSILSNRALLVFVNPCSSKICSCFYYFSSVLNHVFIHFLLLSCISFFSSFFLCFWGAFFGS